MRNILSKIRKQKILPHPSPAEFYPKSQKKTPLNKKLKNNKSKFESTEKYV